MKSVGCPIINVSNKAVEETAGLVFGHFKRKEGKIVTKKFVYLFNEGNSNMKELLGGKGANLAEMTNIGLTCSIWVYDHQQKPVMIIMKHGKQISEE